MEPPIAEHIVGTTRGRVSRLTEFELAWWLWSHLAAAVPDAFSFVLMPDHFHLMAPPGRLDRVRRVLSGFTGCFSIRMDVRAPERASTRKILGRQIRYGFYNPVGAGLVTDPWCWPWSTLRDLGGACTPIWTPLEHVAGALRLSSARALDGLTRFGDERSPRPQLIAPQVASVNQVLRATAAALRHPAERIPTLRAGRRLAVQVAASVQHPLPSSLLADTLNISARAIRKLRQPPHPGLRAARMCLGDARLQGPR